MIYLIDVEKEWIDRNINRRDAICVEQRLGDKVVIPIEYNSLGKIRIAGRIIC